MYDPDGSRYNMMNGGDAGGGWMIGFAVLTTVLLLLALAAVVANLYFHVSPRRAAAQAHAELPASEARLLLDLRLARGDITPEGYQALRAALDR